MARTTLELMQESATFLTTSVGGFIAPASVMINNMVAGGCTGYDDETLELIERYLALHFLFLNERRAKTESADGTSETYEGGRMGTGLSSTEWGQAALTIDVNGCLSKSNDVRIHRTASFSWGGKDLDE